MARSRALRRFLRVLELEEEQHRARMASALADLHHLEKLLTAAEDRERAGRRLMNESAQTGKVVDRLAGREESQLARKRAALLKPQIADAEEVARAQRESFSRSVSSGNRRRRSSRSRRLQTQSKPAGAGSGRWTTGFCGGCGRSAICKSGRRARDRRAEWLERERGQGWDCEWLGAFGRAQKQIIGISEENRFGNQGTIR